MNGACASGPEPAPATIVILGASGDLTRRKLAPALYNLYREGRLPSGTRVVGFARRPYDHEQFRSLLREGVKEFSGATLDAETWEGFAANCTTHAEISPLPATTRACKRT